MVSPLKRPFKIWSKSSVYNPNIARFNSFLLSSEIPGFFEYFFLTNLRPVKFNRRVIVRSAEYAYMRKETIEAFRKVIAPHFRKKAKGFSKFYIRCYPYLPLMKKPAEVRMGGVRVVNFVVLFVQLDQVKFFSRLALSHFLGR